VVEDWEDRTLGVLEDWEDRTLGVMKDWERWRIRWVDLGCWEWGSSVG